MISTREPVPIYLKYLLLVLGIISILKNTDCQESSADYILERGVGTGLLVGVPLYLLPEGDFYSPKIFNGYYHYPLSKKKKKINFSLDFIPHAAIVPTTNNQNFEVGLNMFLNMTFGLNPNTLVSLIVGSGPHYFSVVTDRQIRGFIFSDHLLMSLRKKIKIYGEPVELIGFAGFRHISNGSLRQPNRGINNVVMGIQINKTFSGKFVSIN